MSSSRRNGQSGAGRRRLRFPYPWHALTGPGASSAAKTAGPKARRRDIRMSLFVEHCTGDRGATTTRSGWLTTILFTRTTRVERSGPRFDGCQWVCQTNRIGPRRNVTAGNLWCERGEMGMIIRKWRSSRSVWEFSPARGIGNPARAIIFPPVAQSEPRRPDYTDPALD